MSDPRERAEVNRVISLLMQVLEDEDIDLKTAATVATNFITRVMAFCVVGDGVDQQTLVDTVTEAVKKNVPLVVERVRNDASSFVRPEAG